MSTEALTYRELAERLGIKPESARKMAQRKRWKRVIGNDGCSRVQVPLEALEAPRDVPSPATGDDTRPVTGDSLVRELEVRIEMLKELIAVERRRADAAEVDRDEWRRQAQRGFLARLFG